MIVQLHIQRFFVLIYNSVEHLVHPDKMIEDFPGQRRFQGLVVRDLTSLVFLVTNAYKRHSGNDYHQTDQGSEYNKHFFTKRNVFECHGTSSNTMWLMYLPPIF